MQRTILIVDDEEVITGLLQEYFQGMGYNVLTAGGGEEGLELIKERAEISLVLTDVKMSGMSGIDLLKMIREYRMDLPVIIITGYQTIENAIAAIKYGAMDYISKPFDLDNVRKIVEKIFS